MGTYDKPFGQINPYLIDRSADALRKSINSTITAYDLQMANIQASKDDLNKEKLKYKESLSSAEALSDDAFVKELTSMYSDLVDQNYILGYNSIGRDQTAYLESNQKINKSLQTLETGLNLLNLEADEYNKTKGNRDSLVSRRTGKGEAAFVNDILENNGNNIKPYMENGNVMLKIEGENPYTLNLSNYVNSVEKSGQGLIEYTEDPSDTLKSIFDNYAKNYDEKIKQWQELSDNGKKITTRSQTIYDEVNAGVRKDMINDTRLLAELNQDSWQIMSNMSGDFLKTAPDEVWDPENNPDQVSRLKNAMIEYAISNFGNENSLTKEITKLRTPQKPKVVIDKNKPKKDYSEIFNYELNTAQNILASEDPLSMYAQYLRDQSPTNPPLLDIEDDVLYITTFKGTGAKPQQIRTPLITLDALNNTDLKDFIVRINTDRGKDNMIPTDRLSDYLKLIQIQEESEEQAETPTDEETVTDTKVPGATPTIEIPTTESQILDFDMKMLDDAVKNMSFSKYNYLRKIVDLPPIPDDVTFEKYKQSLEDAYYGRETDEELLKEQNKIIPVLKEQMKKFADRKRAQMDPKQVL